MEVSHDVRVTAKTRGSLAMAEERKEEVKRRKFDSGELEFRRPLVMIKPDNIPVSPENSTTTRVFSSDRCSSTSWEQLTSSRCSTNGSCEIVNGILRSDIDPESEGFQFQNSTYFAGDRARREATPSSSDLSSKESNQMPSAEANSARSSSNAEKMPSEAEIESFFSAAEKEEQKRFAERYNYDIVKDIPLEGRFVWVPLKP